MQETSSSCGSNAMTSPSCVASSGCKGLHTQVATYSLLCLLVKALAKPWNLIYDQSKSLRPNYSDPHGFAFSVLSAAEFSTCRGSWRGSRHSSTADCCCSYSTQRARERMDNMRHQLCAYYKYLQHIHKLKLDEIMIYYDLCKLLILLYWLVVSGTFCFLLEIGR